MPGDDRHSRTTRYDRTKPRVAMTLSKTRAPSDANDSSESKPVVAGLSAAARGRADVVAVVRTISGFSHLGCYGSSIETPNIDGLAAVVCAARTSTPPRFARRPAQRSSPAETITRSACAGSRTGTPAFRTAPGRSQERRHDRGDAASDTATPRSWSASGT